MLTYDEDAERKWLEDQQVWLKSFYLTYGNVGSNTYFRVGSCNEPKNTTGLWEDENNSETLNE